MSGRLVRKIISIPDQVHNRGVRRTSIRSKAVMLLHCKRGRERNPGSLRQSQVLFFLKPVIDESPVAQLPHPFLVGFVGLAGAQRLPRRQTLPLV